CTASAPSSASNNVVVWPATNAPSDKTLTPRSAPDDSRSSNADLPQVVETGTADTERARQHIGVLAEHRCRTVRAVQRRSGAEARTGHEEGAHTGLGRGHEH